MLIDYLCRILWWAIGNASLDLDIKNGDMEHRQ